MNLNLYGYGALLLICAALYGWATIESKSVEAKQAELNAKQKELDRAKADLAAVVQVNEDNKTQITILKGDLQYQSDLAVKYEAQARSRDKRLNSTLKGISDAPATDDGPVAPVLEQLLDGMRARYAEATGHNENTDRASDAPSQ